MDIFLFVLGYIIQLIASGILFYRIKSVRSIYGLAIDTQICFLLSSLSRLVWTVNTRIYEANGAFVTIAFLEMLLSVAAAIGLVYHFVQLRHTTTVSVPLLMSYKVLVPVSFALAYMVNPGGWFNVSSQLLVAFNMYVEACALVPQLWLIRKMEDVEALTSHYIGLLVIARGVRMVFWIALFMGGDRFISLFLADVFHTVLSADYLYLWIRKLRHGGRLVYSL
jgi:ER lumen protein retaining receptor